tara:strand:- start:488 stop:883 length:396 start_codon:yes stop_codon:yes gene_type:complete
MNNTKPILFHHSDPLSDNPTSPDFVWQRFSGFTDQWFGWAEKISSKPGDTSSWHYHPTSTTYVYVIKGSVTINFGPSGEEAFTAASGDFFIIPPNVIHRESTDSEVTLEAFVVRIGELPKEIEVEDPGSTE